MGTRNQNFLSSVSRISKPIEYLLIDLARDLGTGMTSGATGRIRTDAG
jgi:hypothetical protein